VLTTRPLESVPQPFDSTQQITNQKAGQWEYLRFDVPANVVGWDLRVKNVTAGAPQLVVRRDVLPDGFTAATASRFLGMRSGRAVINGRRRWTGRGGRTGLERVSMSMTGGWSWGWGVRWNRGLITWAIYNASGEAASYTLESRGIGTGRTIPVGTLASRRAAR